MTTTPDAAAQLRSTQVVVVSLAVGVAIFAAIAAAVGPIDAPMPRVGGFDALLVTALVVTITTVPLAFFLPARLVEAARGLDPARRIGAFRASRIVAAAMCEAAALLWCVALLVSGTLLYLAPIAVIVAVTFLQVPTREALESATGERVREG